MTEVIRVHQPNLLLGLVGLGFGVVGFAIIGMLCYIGANPRQPMGRPFLKACIGGLVIFAVFAAYTAKANPVELVKLGDDLVTLLYTHGQQITLAEGDVQSILLAHPIPPKSGPSTIRLESMTGKPYLINVAKRDARDVAKKMHFTRD